MHGDYNFSFFWKPLFVDKKKVTHQIEPWSEDFSKMSKCITQKCATLSPHKASIRIHHKTPFVCHRYGVV